MQSNTCRDFFQTNMQSRLVCNLDEERTGSGLHADTSVLVSRYVLTLKSSVDKN